jgi:hypothetical protein
MIQMAANILILNTIIIDDFCRNFSAKEQIAYTKLNCQVKSEMAKTRVTKKQPGGLFLDFIGFFRV